MTEFVRTFCMARTYCWMLQHKTHFRPAHVQQQQQHLHSITLAHNNFGQTTQANIFESVLAAFRFCSFWFTSAFSCCLLCMRAASLWLSRNIFGIFLCIQSASQPASRHIWTPELHCSSYGENTLRAIFTTKHPCTRREKCVNFITSSHYTCQTYCNLSAAYVFSFLISVNLFYGKT